MKRIDGRTSIYFLANACRGDVETEVVFPEGGRVVRFEADTGKCFIVSSCGRVRMRLSGGESAIFFAGETPAAECFAPAGMPEQEIKDGWMARKTAAYTVGQRRLERRLVEERPKPVRLGDWRRDFGDTFSGRVVYSAEFSSKAAGLVEIDLGVVRYCAGVALNGCDLGKRFFGPYKWRAFVKKGVNRLEVDVCNLLVNQTGNEQIRERVNRDHPPRSSYDTWQRPFDLLNHDSGLYGPVTIAPVPGTVWGQAPERALK